MIRVALFLLLCALAAAPAPSHDPAGADFALEPCQPEGVDREARCGVYRVFENRGTMQGRTLPIRVMVLPARSSHPDPEPIFYFPGGPGVPATRAAQSLDQDWTSAEHDVVMIDHRGTGDGHRLNCVVSGSDDDLQSYFNEPFGAENDYTGCRERLSAEFDLSQFSSVAAMQDIDEIREALGYPKIHIVGESYGTRNAVTYISMFGEHVASAQLAGPLPPSNRNPLYHAAAAQHAFDALAALCASDPRCAEAYPDLPGDLRAILARIEAEPVRVEIAHPVTGEPTPVEISAASFGEALRTFMYGTEAARRVPLLLHRAREGDFAPFAEVGLRSNRGIRNVIAMGLLLSVTCNEDIPRIRPEEIGPLTDGTFLGDQRVRGQIAVCEVWPRTELPAGIADPPPSDVPVVIVTGDLDPVTPPQWGEAMGQLFPDHLHLSAPGGHDVSNDCIIAITQELFRGTATDAIDTSCMDALERQPFLLPGEETTEADAAS